MAYNKTMTGKTRITFPHLFTPSAYGNNPSPDAAKYSCCLLIRKDDALTVGRLRDAIEKAIQEGIQTKWDGKRPANLKDPLRDGDQERDGEEYKGCYFVNCTTKRKPPVVDRDCNAITDPSEIYSGCYVRATLNAYPYNFAGNKGISLGLNAIQKLSDGEPLGGNGSGASDFSSDAAKTELDELEDF